MIVKLVDTNDDGVVSVGDTVVTGQYPEDFDATTFGSFAMTQHVVDAVAGASSVRAGTFKFAWADLPDAEAYSEFDVDDPLPTATEFTDALSSTSVFGEGILVNTTCPTAPRSSVEWWSWRESNL